MIVLSRQEQQAIVIGDGLVIKVLKIDGDNVEIEIDNPNDMPIKKEEPKKPVT